MLKTGMKKATTSNKESASELEENIVAELEKLRQKLEELWLSRQTEVSKEWDRTLPFADYFVDRWRKAELLGFGEGSSVYDNSLIIGQVSVGKNTWIGPNTILDGSGGLTIGDNCSISAGVQVYTHDSIEWALSSDNKPLDKAPTIVGNNCYIGPNVVIAKGITIGDRCVIGANSLVLYDIETGSKAHGTPCKIVGKSCQE